MKTLGEVAKPGDAAVASFLACGDVGPLWTREGGYTEFVADRIRQADIRFAQSERIYTTRGSLQVHMGLDSEYANRTRLDPAMASIFTEAGFNLVSVAGNHALDWGVEGFLDTIELLHGSGIRTVGGGANIEEARTPAITEVNGLRVAVLSYCSVLREGYEARPGTPGVAPMRAHTYYGPKEFQPGTPPQVITVPYHDDLDALRHDIEKAKDGCDAVFVSFHWGLHFVPKQLADYERTVAHAAVDAGADLIVGHHPHLPKGIEVYRGVVIFYSIGNFLMTPNGGSGAPRYDLDGGHRAAVDPLYVPHDRRSLAVSARVSRSGIDVRFLPALIDEERRPQFLHAADPRFADMVAYLEWASESFDPKFTVIADEVQVVA